MGEFGGSKMRVSSMFGGLGGDFYKDTYEAKLFGVHSGRFSLMWISHGSQPFRRYTIHYLCFGSKRVCVVKHDVFLKFGDREGDFYKETHEAKLFGMLLGSVLSGLEAGNVNNDKKNTDSGL